MSRQIDDLLEDTGQADVLNNHPGKLSTLLRQAPRRKINVKPIKKSADAKRCRKPPANDTSRASKPASSLRLLREKNACFLRILFYFILMRYHVSRQLVKQHLLRVFI